MDISNTPTFLSLFLNNYTVFRIKNLTKCIILDTWRKEHVNTLTEPFIAAMWKDIQ